MRKALAALVVSLWTTAVSGVDHVVKSGEKVRDIAAKHYGSEHYHLVILRHNKIKDVLKIKAGQILSIPDLKDMLFEDGLAKTMTAEIDDIMAGRYSYMKVRHDLVKTMQLAKTAKKTKVPVHIRDELKGAADKIEAAGRELAKKGKFGESPTRIKQRLEECARKLRKLAGGSTDEKLEDQIHLLFAQAFVRGIMWGRGEEGGD